MKKLYQLTAVLFLFINISKVYSMTKDATTECYVPTNFGTSSEEVVTISPVTGSAYGRCTWDTPSFLTSNPSDPRKALCAQVQKCVYKGLAVSPDTPAGSSMYIAADPGPVAGYASAIQNTGTSMSLADKAYATLSACQADNPNRVVGLIPSSLGGTGVTSFQKFPDLNSCKVAYTSATTTSVGSAQSDGGCYFGSPNSGKQAELLRNAGMSMSVISDEIKCSCATRPDSIGQMTDVFVVSPTGSVKTYFTGSSIGTATSSGYTTAKQKCLNENTNRFYSPTTKQCYSDLATCKAANTTAAVTNCTEADENKLFVVVPPATKTVVDATTEAARRTSVANCVKTGKTITQCINTYFGAGPTSTVLSNDNFYRCTCLYDNSGILGTTCTLTGALCTKVCKLKKEGFANYQTSKAVTASSPLAFIKVLSDFLFWLAILIFVINFLRAGLSYAQSKGEEAKLKDASAILTSTIGGIIFILLIGGLVRYILDTLSSAGLK